MLQRRSFRQKAGPRSTKTWNQFSLLPHKPLEKVSIFLDLLRATSHIYLDVGAIHQIGAPIHIYPLFENGFRAHRKQTIQQNNMESAQLYAEFAQVAATNAQSWQYGKPPASKEVIGTVSKKNRMICFPCTVPLLYANV